jgi:hypothetical protein
MSVISCSFLTANSLKEISLIAVAKSPKIIDTFNLTSLVQSRSKGQGYNYWRLLNMKKMIFLGLAMTVIASNPFNVSAATDSKYPAADFEPSVIYIDKDAVAKDQAQNESDPTYPASSFTPIVVFVDNQSVDQTQDEFDPKFPAAYFTPKVIYP